MTAGRSRTLSEDVTSCLLSIRNHHDLSEQLRIPISTISMTLRHLRQMDVVRYETSGRNKEYWVKDGKVLSILERTVRTVGC